LQQRPELLGLTALPVRPLYFVSMLEAGFVSKVCNMVAVVCFCMWINLQLRQISDETSLAFAGHPAEAARSALRPAGVTALLPHVLSEWSVSDIAWWLRSQHGLDVPALYMSAAGIDGSLMCHMSSDADLAALGIPSAIDRTRVLGVFETLRQRLAEFEFGADETRYKPTTYTGGGLGTTAAAVSNQAESVEVCRPLDFWRYRQAHRKQVTLLTASICAFPRTTLAYLWLFEADLQPWPMFKVACERLLAAARAQLLTAPPPTEPTTEPGALDSSTGAGRDGAVASMVLLPVCFLLCFVIAPQLVYVTISMIFLDTTNMWMVFVRHTLQDLCRVLLRWV
jgi:hypothetical protein